MTAPRPSHIVHRAHGSPLIDDCEPAPGRCFVCGDAMARGKPVTDWLGSNYTDQNRCRVPTATHVCEACVFVHSRTSPVLGRPPGKCTGCAGTGRVTAVAKKGKTRNSSVGDPCPKCEGSGAQTFGANLRNVAHLWEDGWDSSAFAPDVDEETGSVRGFRGPAGLGYVNASKGEKPLIRAFLEREHASAWFGAIPDSGQKHVIPFTPLNGPGRRGLVLFEETLVEIPEDLALVVEMAELLTEGVTKDEIERGEYYVRSMRERREAVERFELASGAERDSGWFSLALWLAQRDNDEYERREAAKKETDQRDSKQRSRPKKTAGNSDARTPARAKARVHAKSQRQAADGLLDEIPESNASVIASDGDGERVDELRDARRASGVVGQGRLPGFD